MSGSSEINKQLESIYVNLSSLQGTQVNAMTKQTNVKQLIDGETNRLNAKKNTIDQAVDNQKRIIYFNDNSRKMSLAYLRILITIAISLAMVYLVRVVFHHYGDSLPDMLFNVLIVAIVSIGMIVSYNYYLAILRRDPYNFDELKLSRPDMGNISGNTDDKLKIGSFASCVGSQCCTPSTPDSPGTEWNETQGKCVYSPGGAVSTIPPSTEPVSSTPPYSTSPSYSSVS